MASNVQCERGTCFVHGFVHGDGMDLEASAFCWSMLGSLVKEKQWGSFFRA